jgi:hypothetical protein
MSYPCLRYEGGIATTNTLSLGAFAKMTSKTSTSVGDGKTGNSHGITIGGSGTHCATLTTPTPTPTPTPTATTNSGGTGSSYNNRARKALAEKIKSLGKTEHDELLRILKGHLVPYTQNNNGVFINMSAVSDEVLSKMAGFVDFCLSNMQELNDYDKRLNDCKRSSVAGGASVIGSGRGGAGGAPSATGGVNNDALVDHAPSTTATTNINIHNHYAMMMSAANEPKDSLHGLFPVAAASGTNVDAGTTNIIVNSQLHHCHDDDIESGNSNNTSYNNNTTNHHNNNTTSTKNNNNNDKQVSDGRTKEDWNGLVAAVSVNQQAVSAFQTGLTSASQTVPAAKKKVCTKFNLAKKKYSKKRVIDTGKAHDVGNELMPDLM